MNHEQCIRRPRRALCILHCALLVAISACGRGDQPGASASLASTSAAPVDRKTLKLIALPDLSKAGPAVQKQLRDAYAAFTARTQTAGISDADLGRAYGEIGMLLMAAEYRDGADAAFENAQALTPDDFRWPYYRAHNEKLRGNAATSLAFFERAHQVQPDDVATLVWLGGAYLDQGRASDAEPLFMRALSQQPQAVAVQFGLGRTALEKKEYSRAAQYLEQALTIDPKAAAIHYPLAMAYRAMGNVEQAETHLKQRNPGDVLPPDPLMDQLNALLESAVAYEVRGAQALDEGKWPDAARYFRRGTELAPDEPSLHHKLGTALAMTGDTQGAVDQFQLVVRRWPSFAKAQYSYGVILAANNRHREAIEHFQAAIRSEPQYVEAHMQLAEALRASGRLQEALAEYDATSRLDPRVAEARLGAAMALAALNRIPQARTRLTEAMKIYPDRPEFAEALSRLPVPSGERR
jgi:tetratricopeptide (TPR) repeat protein